MTSFRPKISNSPTTQLDSLTVSKADSSADKENTGAGAGAGTGVVGAAPNKEAKLLKSGMPPAAPGAPVMADLRRSAAWRIWRQQGQQLAKTRHRACLDWTDRSLP